MQTRVCSTDPGPGAAAACPADRAAPRTGGWSPARGGWAGGGSTAGGTPTAPPRPAPSSPPAHTLVTMYLDRVYPHSHEAEHPEVGAGEGKLAVVEATEPQQEHGRQHHGLG